MRKFINISALVVFIWLLLDALTIPSILLNFLLAGQLPFFGISLPPTMMLAIYTTIALVIIFEMFARRNETIARIRQQIHMSVSGSKRVSRRRLGRV